MKRIQLILVISFAIAAVVLLWQNNQLRGQESSLREKMAGNSKPAATGFAADGSRETRHSNRPSRPRDVALDPDRLIAGYNKLLDERGYSVEGIREIVRDQAGSASNAEILKVCERIKESGLKDMPQELVLAMLLSHIAKSDPSLAFNEFDKFKTAQARRGAGIYHQLAEFRKDSEIAYGNWNPEYAAALGEWLDSAQEAGRLKDNDKKLAANTRCDIAILLGDLSGAAEQIAMLPPDEQSGRSAQLAKAAVTPELRRNLIEQLNTPAGSSAIQEIALSFSRDAGFEATRDLIEQANLTPENHDLAAGGIAAANFGPEAPARAAWLLESLKSEKTGVVSNFASSWAHADQMAATQWLNSLPTGKNRDAAVAGFAPAAARLDGASAVDWALTVSDSVQRDSTLKAVIQTWHRKEPEAASAYLKQKGIEL
ncbi:MAG: hypothetical protein V4727_10850 [Verrucomicrobiota bacterium]